MRAAYVDQVAGRFDLGPQSQVIEIASNDGYLLQFVCRRGIPALGIEPAANVAKLAEEKGVPTRVAFFGRDTARSLVAEGLAADLTVANNVLAHVPDLNDFVSGFAVILKSEGVATFEFPHLANLIGQTQFDTIYHEHFSYISLLAARNFFSPTFAAGLRRRKTADPWRLAPACTFAATTPVYATTPGGRRAHRRRKATRP